MFSLFSQGGPLFMGVLSLILISLITVFILALSRKGDERKLSKSVQWLKTIGTLGLVVGILGQLIGLFSAFSIMETSQGISTEILAGGLKVSLITTIYGVLIYILNLVLTMLIKRFG